MFLILVLTLKFYTFTVICLSDKWLVGLTKIGFLRDLLSDKKISISHSLIHLDKVRQASFFLPNLFLFSQYFYQK